MRCSRIEREVLRCVVASSFCPVFSFPSSSLSESPFRIHSFRNGHEKGMKIARRIGAKGCGESRAKRLICDITERMQEQDDDND